MRDDESVQILHLSHEPEEAACTASSTGAARCNAPILCASPAAEPTKVSSLWRSPGWNRHALTKGLHTGFYSAGACAMSQLYLQDGQDFWQAANPSMQCLCVLFLSIMMLLNGPRT